ncbi:MAG: ABC transporter ATP-binding protein [Mycoplasmataceae bacterium]|nr:ABC transporter ATP-binding protein [Mycoplasmataceae bacterium]
MVNALDVQHLNYKKGKYVILNDVNFTVPHNAICIFAGNNGAGKTSTIKNILNLIPNKYGDVFIYGASSTKTISRNGVGYLSEKENFKLNISSRHFLYEQSLCSGNTINETNALIKLYTNKFCLSETKMEMPFKLLSSGLKKVVLIINAIICGHKLIILDEPTEYLDPKTRIIFNQVMKQLHAKGKTIFISTHNLKDVDNLINWLVIIEDGHIKYCGKRNTKKEIGAFFIE